MNMQEIKRALEVLEEAGYANYDSQNDVFLDRLALKFFQPSGDKQIKGAVRVFSQVPESPLRVEFLKLAYIYAKDFADHIVETCPELAAPALGGNPMEGVSANSDTPSTNHEQIGVLPSNQGASKGYPEPEIPRLDVRGRSGSKHLEDDVEADVAGAEQPEVYDPVEHLKSELGAEAVWPRDSR